MSVNSVVLSGRLGTDPTIFRNKEHIMAKFTVATTTYRGSKDVTDWHSIETFSNIAEYVEKFIKKGDYVIITGYLSWTIFKGRDGKDKKIYNVKATSIEKPKLKDDDDVPSVVTNSKEHTDESPY